MALLNWAVVKELKSSTAVGKPYHLPYIHIMAIIMIVIIEIVIAIVIVIVIVVGIIAIMLIITMITTTVEDTRIVSAAQQQAREGVQAEHGLGSESWMPDARGRPGCR